MPYAIVIGLDTVQGLQTARILADRRIPVIGIASNPRHYACSTRVCEQILHADTGSDELAEMLTTLGPKLNQKAVLFPCNDTSVLEVSRVREKLTPWYHVVLPDHDVLEMLIDKVQFYAYADEKGFPVPRSCFLYSRADAEAAAERLLYPVVLKPPFRPNQWTRHTQQKAFKATGASELLAWYDHCHRWADVLIAQEWIEGPDTNLYSCNCYFDAKGQPLVTFVARKIRQWPPFTGQSSLGEECRDDFVLEETIRLFCGVNFRGLGYLEIKRDERSGKYFIVEPNIGRPTGRSAIAELGGVELLYTMYCEALGWPLPPNREQKYAGVKWIHLLRDMRSALHEWRNGELTLKEWRRSLRGCKTDAVFSWRDPLPFLKALLTALPAMRPAREPSKEAV